MPKSVISPSLGRLNIPNTDGTAGECQHCREPWSVGNVPLRTLVQDLHFVVVDATGGRYGVIRTRCARLAVAHAGGAGKRQFPTVERDAQRGRTVLLGPSCREHQDGIGAEHRYRSDSGGRGRGRDDALVIAVS